MKSEIIQSPVGRDKRRLRSCHSHQLPRAPELEHTNPATLGMRGGCGPRRFKGNGTCPLPFPETNQLGYFEANPNGCGFKKRHPKWNPDKWTHGLFNLRSTSWFNFDTQITMDTQPLQLPRDLEIRVCWPHGTTSRSSEWVPVTSRQVVACSYLLEQMTHEKSWCVCVFFFRVGSATKKDPDLPETAPEIRGQIKLRLIPAA